MLIVLATCGNGYCGYIESRSRSTQLSYINGISQKSICIITMGWLWMEDKIKKLQLECDELFKVNGLTDEVLDLQLKINKLKHEHDIVLEEDKLFEDFVQ